MWSNEDIQDDDDEGYAIMLDHRGAHSWDGRKFNPITQSQLSQLMENREQATRVKKFPKANALGLTSLTVKEHEMVMKNRNKRQPFLNTFYLGAVHIAARIAAGLNAENTVATEAEAIEQAKHRVESGNSECEIVVKIVAVIKRADRPVRVVKL